MRYKNSLGDLVYSLKMFLVVVLGISDLFIEVNEVL